MTKSPKSNIKKPRSFSLEFKKLVVQEYLNGDCTKQFIQDKYGIRGNSAIHKWLNQFNFQEEKSIFTKKNFMEMNKVKKVNITTDKLKQKTLEQENQDLKLLVEYYQRVISTAEKDMKIVIEKKLDTK